MPFHQRWFSSYSATTAHADHNSTPLHEKVISDSDRVEYEDEELPSDLDDDAAVVDLDYGKQSSDEGCNSATSGAESWESDNATAGWHASGGPPGGHATGGLPAYGTSGPKMWDNGYVYIACNALHLKTLICPQFLANPPAGMGSKPTISKTRMCGQKFRMSPVPG